LKRANSHENQSIGIFSVGLEKYSIDEGRPLTFYDSLGIQCDAFGRWKDIQGPCSIANRKEIKYEAICGAFMLCKSTALKALPDSRGNIGFEESFYMYKEDIELSLRLGKQWGIKVFTDLKAYHCRGWGEQGIQTHTGLVNIQLRMIYILLFTINFVHYPMPS
jgi:GT2 family glycosyltransferase